MSAPPRRGSTPWRPTSSCFASSEVWPVIREYERTTTAILNGYVHPRVAGYLIVAGAALGERGVPARPMLTKSNGGIMNVAAGKHALRQHAALRHGLRRHGRGLLGARLRGSATF